jgi:type III secretion protein U
VSDTTQEKTEKPTAKRLRDARKRGEVVRSNDVSGTLVFVALLLLFAVGGDFFWRHLAAIETLPGQVLKHTDLAVRWPDLLRQLFKEFLFIVAPVMGVILIAALAGMFLQVKSLLSFEPLKPNVARINPARGIKHVFSVRNLINLLKTTIKTILLGSILFVVIRGSLDAIVHTGYLPPQGIQQFGMALLFKIMTWSAVVYAIMAAVDYAHQHYEFMKQQKMSREELRRELKETEGDPLIKSHRRSILRKFAMTDMLMEVRSAAVVIDDLRIAVALRYEPGVTELPLVVAKGEDAAAQRIREAAQAAGIPVQRNAALVRRLQESATLDQYIPQQLFESVAESLRWAKQNR